jgi:hypothetical protein
MTRGSEADNDVARRRPGTVAGFADASEDVDDTGDVKLGREFGSRA